MRKFPKVRKASEKDYTVNDSVMQRAKEKETVNLIINNPPTDYLNDILSNELKTGALTLRYKTM